MLHIGFCNGSRRLTRRLNPLSPTSACHIPSGISIGALSSLSLTPASLLSNRIRLQCKAYLAEAGLFFFFLASFFSWGEVWFDKRSARVKVPDGPPTRRRRAQTASAFSRSYNSKILVCTSLLWRSCLVLLLCAAIPTPNNLMTTPSPRLGRGSARCESALEGYIETSDLSTMEPWPASVEVESVALK